MHVGLADHRVRAFPLGKGVEQLLAHGVRIGRFLPDKGTAADVDHDASDSQQDEQGQYPTGDEQGDLGERAILEIEQPGHEAFLFLLEVTRAIGLRLHGVDGQIELTRPDTRQDGALGRRKHVFMPCVRGVAGTGSGEDAGRIFLGEVPGPDGAHADPGAHGRTSGSRGDEAFFFFDLA